MNPFGERSLMIRHHRYKILRRNFTAVQKMGQFPRQPNPLLKVVTLAPLLWSPTREGYTVIPVSLVKSSWTQFGILLDSHP